MNIKKNLLQNTQEPKGLDSAQGNFLLLPPLKTLKNKYDRTNKIQREVIKLPKT
jgi:hypothetical protein